MSTEKLKQKLKFTSVGELLSYRDIHSEAIKSLEASTISLSDAQNLKLARHKEYLLLIDLFLHDAFFTSAKEQLESGIQIDPILCPEANVGNFLNATALLKIAPPEEKQTKLLFEEEKKPIPVVAISEKTSKLPLETLIAEIFKEHKNEIPTVVSAAKIYASKVGIDVNNTELSEILKKFVNDERFSYVKNFPKINLASLWMLKLLKQYDNPVPAMLSLKMKFFDSDPMEIGQLFAFLTEFAFNKHVKEDKVFGWTWKQYTAAMDKCYRLLINEEDLAKYERIEPEKLQGVLIARDRNFINEVKDNEDIVKRYHGYVSSITDPERRKLFMNEKKEILPKTFYNTINDCLMYGSELRRKSIVEHRISQMTGATPMKEYKEGESGYSKSTTS